MTASGWAWVVAIATLLGALFSAIFHSLKDMSRGRLEEIAKSRGETSELLRVERIIERVGEHSTAVALPRLICHAVAAVAAWAYADAMLPGSSPLWAEMLLGVAIASLLAWIFGLLIPHAVARYAPEGTVYAWAWLVRGCYYLQRPLSPLVAFFDELVRRLSGRPRVSHAEELQAELMSVVEEAQHSGQFDVTEARMIQALTGFRGTTVEQIMTPRTEIEALELTNNLGEVIRFIRACRHSRIPVYEGSLDHVVGMFYVKDLMRWLAGDNVRSAGKPFELKSILRPAIFVPETKTIRELLQELLDKKVHAAMVADEYGGTSGMVSLEDIVEEIFGEIQDEYEKPEDDAPEITLAEGDRSAEIDARAYIDDANAALAPIGLRLPEGEDYDTVGGLVVTTMGRIPAPGETLIVEPAANADAPAMGSDLKLALTVLEAEPTRVIRVRVERREAESTGKDAGKEVADSVIEVTDAERDAARA